MKLFILSLLALSFQIQFNAGHCKTISSNSKPLKAEEYEGRGLDNFVEFTEEGDQLAVESSGLSLASEFSGGKSDSRREILGKGNGSSARKCQDTTLQCPHVHKVLYPVIPVIVASLIGLISAIVISAIFRLVYRIKGENQNHDSDMNSGFVKNSLINYEAGMDYGRRQSGYHFLGYDLTNINYTRLLKNVLTAIDKVY